MNCQNIASGAHTVLDIFLDIEISFELSLLSVFWCIIRLEGKSSKVDFLDLAYGLHPFPCSWDVSHLRTIKRAVHNDFHYYSK